MAQWRFSDRGASNNVQTLPVLFWRPPQVLLPEKVLCGRCLSRRFCSSEFFSLYLLLWIIFDVHVFNIVLAFSFIFIFLFIYFFEERRGGREKEWEGEKHRCGVASFTPPVWGPGLQPRQVPWLGIKLVTFHFAGRHSVHWATPARAIFIFLMMIFLHSSLDVALSRD